MMTDQELQFILSEGEGLFVEFKERPDKSLAREMSAFANASGGRIFVGVSDESQAVGIQVDNRLKSQIEDRRHSLAGRVHRRVHRKLHRKFWRQWGIIRK